MAMLNIEVTLTHSENWCVENAITLLQIASKDLDSFLDYRHNYQSSIRDDVAFLIEFVWKNLKATIQKPSYQRWRAIDYRLLANWANVLT